MVSAACGLRYSGWSLVITPSRRSSRACEAVTVTPAKVGREVRSPAAPVRWLSSPTLDRSTSEGGREAPSGRLGASAVAGPTGVGEEGRLSFSLPTSSSLSCVCGLLCRRTTRAPAVTRLRSSGMHRCATMRAGSYLGRGLGLGLGS